MKFNESWLQDPTIFAINRLPAHSDHSWYGSEEDFLDDQNHLQLSLDGQWKFHYAKNLTGRIENFESLLYDCRDWDDIKVPGHIQMQGYGTPAYVNIMYPWSGKEQLHPGEIPTHDHPVGSYVKYFDLPEAFVGHPIHLTFEGVETAFVVYLNGIFVGYSEDSFTPAHFDVSEYVVSGPNKLAVQVFRYASSSWLEDQDFWRFSGIFRHVTLTALPAMHVYDLKVESTLEDDYQNAKIALDLTFFQQAKGTLLAMIYDQDGEIVLHKSTDVDGKTLQLALDLDHAQLWSAEKPYLYDLVLEIANEAGEIAEFVSQPLGLREIEMIDGIMCLNGQRLILNGVNRHEFSMNSGRAVDEDLIYQDLLIMKQNNINAVRTSHYPNQSCFYHFCDVLGLYVIDETNLETHGTWQLPKDAFDLDQVLPNDRSDFRNAVLDRARSMYERDKNHSCILIWSCGNESFGGQTLYEMAEFFREQDPGRLVHYEGVFNDRRIPDISDIESQMYTPADQVAAYLEQHHDKPFVLCEYAHAMGNSNGALYKYTDLIDQYPQYQGGFIWDFVDQAILKDGKLHYGGDFGERPSDFDFCGNGIVFADRRLTPKMQEVKYCYQPVSMTFDDTNMTITNRLLFTDLEAYDWVAELSYEGELIDQQSFSICLAPLQTLSMPIPMLDELSRTGEYTITVRMLLAADTSYAKAGHEVAFDQVILSSPTTIKPEVTGMPLRISYDGFTIGAVGEHFHILFNLQGLVDYTYGGVHYLHGRTARPNFFRPATQNDQANEYGFRYGDWLKASLYQRITYLGYQTDERLSYLKVSYRHQLMDQDDTSLLLTYWVDRSGEVTVEMQLDPSSQVIEPPEFSYLLTIPKAFDQVTYYGYGPEENYIDRRCGARLGRFEYDVDDNFTPYLMPQECGNRTGVRWAFIQDQAGHGLLFQSEEMEFSALRYLPMEIENARHIDELPEPYETVLRVIAAQMGVAGDNTWGARTHDEFLLPKGQSMTFTFKFKGC